MSALIYGWLFVGQNFSAWVLVPAGMAVGAGAYFAVLWVFRIPELQYVTNGVMKRLTKRLPNAKR
jgi:hypothetical protein